MKAMVVGPRGPAAALVDALRAEGLAAELEPPVQGRSATEVAGLLAGLEERMERERPGVVAAAGVGDAAVAAAITAAKLGIPLAAWSEGAAEEVGLDAAERRILLVLSGLDAGSVGDGSGASEVARRISEWARPGSADGFVSL